MAWKGMDRYMKIVFMGTPDFAVPALQALAAAGHEVLLAITQPDKKKGRGKAVQYPPVKEAALALGIPVLQPVRIREEEWIRRLQEYKPDLGVVSAFGQILPKEILEWPRLGCINIHASLLPKYRGAAPIQQCIIDGEQRSGVTIMQMDEGLDTGAMLAKTEVLLDEEETGGSLHDKLSAAGARLLIDTLPALEAGTVAAVPQEDEKSTYAGMLKKEMGNIDWTRPAVEIERLIRGLNPWPSAYTSFRGKTLKLWRAKVVEMDESKAVSAGEVLAVTKQALVIATGSGALSILELQLEGKKRMDIESFLRGYPVSVGEQLEHISK